jgi:hypothetical protein
VQRKIVYTAAALALLALAPTLEAQERYSFTASALGGIGGSVDADTGDGVDNPSFQLGFSVVTEPRTLIGVRLGRIGFDSAQPLDGLLDAELTYLTVGGEYRLDAGYYQSGLFVGLGAYRLDGRDLAGGDGEQTSVGLTVGTTGEFEITRRVGVLLELAGHYADLDRTQTFVQALGGVSVHF